MTIIEIFKAEMSDISNCHERQAARRYWLRAVIETLHERAMTAMPLPARRMPRGSEKVITVRFVGNWRLVSDRDLYALQSYLSPYFKRSENRGQSLD